MAATGTAFSPGAELLTALAVVLLSVLGLAAYGADAASACMLLATVLKTGAWAYAASLLLAAAMAVAALSRQPQSPKAQQQGETKVVGTEDMQAATCNQVG